MTVTTSNGQTFEIDWMWGPVGLYGDLMLQFRDDRPLSDIVADFTGCEHFHRASKEEGDMDFDGYRDVKSILRPFYETDWPVIQITLTKKRARGESGA